MKVVVKPNFRTFLVPTLQRGNVQGCKRRLLPLSAEPDRFPLGVMGTREIAMDRDTDSGTDEK